MTREGTHRYLDPLGTLTGGRRVEAPINNREYEVLSVLARGVGIKAAAQELGIHPQTVRNHTYRVCRHLDANSLLEALYKLGWVYVPSLAEAAIA